MFGDGVLLALGLGFGWILLCIAAFAVCVLIFYTIVGIQSIRANREWRKRQKGCPDCGTTDDPKRGLGLCRKCARKRIKRTS